MAIIYWAMMWPRMCGILTAFIAGLMLDLLCGSLLGQHALALSVVAYLTLRFHLQIRIFPLWQLTVTAFMLMAIDAFLVFWADGIAGYPSGGIARWTQVHRRRRRLGAGDGAPRQPAAAGREPQQAVSPEMARAVRIKDHWAEQRLFLARLIVAGILIGILITVVVGRLVQLQLVQYDYFSAQSQGNRIRIQPVPPTRGLILDRNGKVLAENQASFDLELTPEQVPDIEDTLRRLVGKRLLDPERPARTSRRRSPLTAASTRSSSATI